MSIFSFGSRSSAGTSKLAALNTTENRFKHSIITLSLFSLALISIGASAQPKEDAVKPTPNSTESVVKTNDPLDAFPAAKAGFTRHVILLPIGNFENDLRVELLPGKVMEVDCNHTMLSGQLEEKTLDGWGYNYYELSSTGQAATTLMGCPDDSKRQEFVPVRSSGSLLHYNSRMPVVVYLPEEFELRWRTWVSTPVISAQPN